MWAVHLQRNWGVLLHTLQEFCLTRSPGVQDSDVGDVRKLRAQAARSFGSHRVMAATDLLTVEVRLPMACTSMDRAGMHPMRFAW